MAQLKRIGLIFVCLQIFVGFIGCALPLRVEQAQPEPKAIDAYIMQLGDVDVLARREAAKDLEATGKSLSTAVVALIEVLDDADSRVRNASAYALLEIGASAVPDLIPALNHKSARVRFSVIDVLGKIGGDITNIDRHPYQKRVHCTLSENVIVPALIPLLQDESSSIRSSVAGALSQIGPAAKGAVPILTTALADENKSVRASAANALGNIGPPAEPKDNWTLTKSMVDVFGPPHVDDGSVCYYFEPWGPACTFLKIHYDGDKIVSIESKFIEHLGPYIPMLIESIRDRRKNDGGTAYKAHKFLVYALQMTYPNGFYYYMHPTIDPFEGTPFKSVELTETTYDEWVRFWEKEGHRLDVHDRE